ncbi:MAG: hypothetical protein DRH56_04450, partial [Deltaproteobacteria bacterium]
MDSSAARNHRVVGDIGAIGAGAVLFRSRLIYPGSVVNIIRYGEAPRREGAGIAFRNPAEGIP